MSTPPAQSTPSNDIQAHLYQAFLNRSLPDVYLRVAGTSWQATYKLHRIVLIQAGFFRTLFTGGFAESSSLASTSLPPKREIDIVFDDTNITRPAFEFCIARLYGGGPQLFQDSSRVATPSQPLTPSWPRPVPPAPVPDGHHLASPRFLMSLIATATYLSIPALVSLSLTFLLRTVGPFTAVKYLNFATGCGIGPREPCDAEPAAGLESVALPYDYAQEDATSMAESDARDAFSRSFETLALARGAQGDSDSEEVKKEDPTDHESSTDSEESHDLYLRYGAVSDMIGQAATIWLARWGVDMLLYELQATSKVPSKSSPLSPPSTPSRPSTAPSPSTSSPAHRLSASLNRLPPSTLSQYPPPIVPIIWRRGGLGASWIRALVSSDTLFVKGERERYEFAKAIVDLRRSEGISGEEEREFSKMFAEGIYYSNMTVEDLVSISQEISPTTRRPYVSRSIVQAAHWSHSLLRHSISHSKSSPPTSPLPNTTAQDHELGIALRSSSLAEGVGSQDIDGEQPYWPVRSEVTERMGDITGLETATMDELFELDHVPVAGSSSKHHRRISPSESTFYGLVNDRRRAADIATHGGADQRWSPHPPFRFAAEFWDVDALREKQRLHSHTIWYAGSLFNIYVQLVRRPGKGPQLGVYVHRQSSVDPLPPISAPFGLTSGANALATAAQRARAGSLSTPMSMPPSSSVLSSFSRLPATPSSRSNTPVPGSPVFTPLDSGSPLAGSPLAASAQSLGAGAMAGVPATAPPCGPPTPYRDPRPQLAAYFTVSCPSTTGTALTRFSSGPDVFAVSQSWGWKSSTLRQEEYFAELGNGTGSVATTPEVHAPSPREVSVRVTVVIGIV